MKPYTLLLLSVLLLAACQDDEMVPDLQTTLRLDQKININGLEREYHIQTPPEPAGKPLVILLHGHGGSSDQSIGAGVGKAVQKTWLDLAEDEDFTVIVPNGTLGPEDTRGWNDCRNDAPGNPETDDVAFISQLIDNTLVEFNYDSDRIYIAGVSNGASMSIRLAQEIPEKIAAFASIVNSMPGNSECPVSDVPLSVLFMNGTADPLVPYEGGQIASNRGLVQSTTASVAYWVARNNTDTQPIVQDFDDRDPDDGSTVKKYHYLNGTNNTEVVLYEVIGGGHTEPSLVERYGNLYLAIVGTQNGDIEMAEEVWDFFRGKTR
ncbi:MAG: PHB depolymerase family esterase [Lewinella sp.]